MLALYEKHVGEIPGGYTPATPAPAASPQPAATGAKSSSKQDSGDQVHFRGSFHIIKPDMEDGKPMMGYDYNSHYVLCTTKDIEFTYTPSIPERYIDPNFVAVLRPLMQEYKSHFEGLDPNTVLCVDAAEIHINGDYQDEDSQSARWVTHDLIKGLWVNHEYPFSNRNNEL
jgi:hypothetical protein